MSINHLSITKTARLLRRFCLSGYRSPARHPGNSPERASTFLETGSRFPSRHFHLTVSGLSKVPKHTLLLASRGMVATPPCSLRPNSAPWLLQRQVPGLEQNRWATGLAAAVTEPQLSGLLRSASYPWIYAPQCAARVAERGAAAVVSGCEVCILCAFRQRGQAPDDPATF